MLKNHTIHKKEWRKEAKRNPLKNTGQLININVNNLSTNWAQNIIRQLDSHSSRITKVVKLYKMALVHYNRRQAKTYAYYLHRIGTTKGNFLSSIKWRNQISLRCLISLNRTNGELIKKARVQTYPHKSIFLANSCTF